MWKDDIDNSTNPFVPRITHKPNALVPLDQSILSGTLDESTIEDSGLRDHVSGVVGDFQPRTFPHPYQYELTQLGYQPWMMDSRQEIMYAPMDSTPITFVDTEEELVKLAATLDRATEIAIDLEAHQYRTFQGFTCLMQISTREADWIIDTLALRKKMQILNSSFTNPNIVKVIHGSDSDILWLQRDFGIYVVNLFDTGQAARVLEFPSYALSYLLKLYCGINADKQYQKADWRIRPLPEPMFRYARDDTHYLLYIYDRMRNEALARVHGSKELVHAILTRSRDLCLQRYEKELCTPTSFRDLLFKFRTVNMTHQQVEVFSAVYNWRDTICRLEDESTRYVLPNHMILQLADKMPEDDRGLQAACIPIPPLVKMNMPELLAVIKKAKAKGTHVQKVSKPSGYGQLPDVPTDVTSSEELIRQAGWANDSASYGFSPVTPNSLGQSGSLSAVYQSSPSSFFDSDLGIGGSLASSSALDGTLGVSGSLDLPVHSESDILSSIPYSDDVKSKAEQIRASFNVSSWMPSTAHIVKDEIPVVSQTSHQSPPRRDPAPTHPGESVGLFEGIPQSMEEIFKLSNQTKKNKKKRDAEDTSTADVTASPQSPFFLQDGDGSMDIRAAKRAKIGETDAERSEFMSELGWGPDTPSKPPTNPAPGHGGKSSKHPSNFSSFDYSRHKEARPAPGHAQQSAARGHHGEQSINPYGPSSKSSAKQNNNSRPSGTGGKSQRGGRGGKTHRTD